MTRSERVHIALVLLTLGVVGYVWLRPGGVLFSLVTRLRVERESQAACRGAQKALDSLGYADGAQGRITVYEFFDYECPWCRTVAPTVRAALDSGYINVVYLHDPLPNHLAARGSAVAAMCAAGQGRFAAFHDHLMGSDAWKADTNWVREASLLGVPDLRTFSECLRSRRVQERLEASIALAKSLRVGGTPTFMTEEQVVVGAVALDAFRELR